ncbi:mitogen-activated protein kinase kinase kinase NPK1 isoform X2 [Punica granatum]|uniref:mitogen-activated protein kinase kinase kinase n=1 Tax=Punica granatum TaxID=22663 RepID=A0A6P8C4H7_PUNGR|nr:mitogen-activated protein kinase kinase kinase NPK1 isoform X2 [Punica granatum]
MQEFLGSVRQSLEFRNLGAGGENGRFGGLVEKIGTSIRKSRIGLLSKPPVTALPPAEDAPPIRWRKGELIGSGAFGRVYMGMNLDSGELLAVKQVLIAANSASKEKTQTQIRELEEEVKLLKNLSHPNIVRYLGTAREEDSLNILLEFVPGGSISSLLGKFGSFPESVIRMYTKQLLLGLDYLHKNGIMHRDIKGANILVDNKGCIKLADFGASKKVVELATINCAKSMKGTPYWMAPEVILQTGHSFSADIWSVGCTVIEMATGKPPWSQQYQEVAALFHIGTTKSHPPIPEHLSAEAKDFLLKCLHKEPHLRPTAAEMLQHLFVTAELLEAQTVLRTSEPGNPAAASGVGLKSLNSLIGRSSSGGLKDVCEIGSTRCSTIYPESHLGVKSPWGAGEDDDMCQIDDKDDFAISASDKFKSISDLNKSFNPMSEPTDGWQCKFEESSEMERNTMKITTADKVIVDDGPDLLDKGESGFSFQCARSTTEDDEEVTESKIRAFLDEKALDLKRLQTPLYEFYNTINTTAPAAAVGTDYAENGTHFPNLPPKSRSPNRIPSRRFSAVIGINSGSPASQEKRLSTAGAAVTQASGEAQVLRDSKQKPPSPSFSERQRKWKEELYQELEMLRQVGMGGKISSPKDRILNRQKDRPRFALPGH